jgi:OFA family oxalate/formate antiporter-like MFS transporter
MEQQTAVGPSLIKNHGWTVTFCAMGINLALGVLYTWSVISKAIPAEWNWTETHKSLPYMIACLVFSLVMVPAGRMQDKIGPRLVASIGGVLVGAGLIIASMTTSIAGYMICFGILAGAGIGFGYASATPPAVKWFSAAKTGLIAGIVVSGFGLASVYVAPLTNWLIAAFSFKSAIMILGILFFIVILSLAQFLKQPPKGYVPAGTKPVAAAGANRNKEDFLPNEMLKTVPFYMLWFMYACGAGAGLMIISKLAAIADKQAGIKLGFILVAVLAVGNGAGRIIAGMLSDKIGRKATMFICFVFQSILIFILSQAQAGNFLGGQYVMAVISALIGANYGANLSLFPSVTKDYYGLKNFGVNYGLVFTSWGVGGFMLAFLAGKIYDIYHTFAIAYYGACILLILAAIMTPFVKHPHRLETAQV